MACNAALLAEIVYDRRFDHLFDLFDLCGCRSAGDGRALRTPGHDRCLHLIGRDLGPWGGGLIDDPSWIEDVSDIGIMFLLYLLGINMLPQQLWRMLGEALSVTLVSCAIFTVIGIGIAFAFGFVWHEALLIGGTMMFSSTIIGLKLLPTTTLHHQHTGQIIISILLLQDLFAILVLLIIEGYGLGSNPLYGVAREFLALHC